MAPSTPIKRIDRQSGFTLIELLTVVSIVSILAVLAIAQFSEYRKHGYDALASYDLGNIRIGEEALYATTEAYATCTNAVCVATVPGFRLSETVTVNVVAVNDSEPSFSATATSSAGNGTVFSYDNSAGP